MARPELNCQSHPKRVWNSWASITGLISHQMQPIPRQTWSPVTKVTTEGADSWRLSTNISSIWESRVFLEGWFEWCMWLCKDNTIFFKVYWKITWTYQGFDFRIESFLLLEITENIHSIQYTVPLSLLSFFLNGNKFSSSFSILGHTVRFQRLISFSLTLQSLIFCFIYFSLSFPSYSSI